MNNSYNSGYEDLRLSDILIVSNSVAKCQNIETTFINNGFKSIELATTRTSDFDIHKCRNFDLLILDADNLEIDVLSFAKKIRQDSACGVLPLVFHISALPTFNQSEALSAGVSDFIVADTHYNEVVTRAIMHLERAKLLSKLIISESRIASELNEAKKMQETIIPGKSSLQEIDDNYNVEVKSLFETSSELGGDVWGVEKIDDHNFALYITDFSGHGIAACLNTFRLHALVNSRPKSEMLKPADFMNFLNGDLTNLLPVEQFATMFYAVIDTKNDKLTYCSAGHTEPVIFSKNNTHKIIDSYGMPLGITKKFKYKEVQIDFKKDDMLLLYSDALIETEDASGEFLPLEEVVDIISNSMSTSPDDHNYIFSSLVLHFAQNYTNNLRDDLTVNMYFR